MCMVYTPVCVLCVSVSVCVCGVCGVSVCVCVCVCERVCECVRACESCENFDVHSRSACHGPQLPVCPSA